MAKEIFLHRIPASESLYFVVIRKSDRQFRHYDASFEGLDLARWGYYANNLSELVGSSGFWFADFAALAAGTYLFAVFKKIGADPDIGDEKVDQFEMFSDAYGWVDDFSTYYNTTEGDARTNDILMALGSGVTVAGFAEGVTVPVDPPTIDTDAIADKVYTKANGVETGVTLKQFCRRIMAVLAGKRTGAGTATEKFRDAADAVDVITATLDESGNRTAITASDTY